MCESETCGGSAASARKATASCAGVLRRELALRLRRERRRADPEESIARVGEALCEPRCGLLHPPVLREPARELLGRLLRAEVGELGGLVGEERARLQLEQRGDEDEELAARLQVERLSLCEQLDEGDDDRGDVDLGEVELLAQDERQEEVERPLEGVQVQLELAHDHRAEASRAAGRGLATYADMLRRGTAGGSHRHRDVTASRRRCTFRLVEPSDRVSPGAMSGGCHRDGHVTGM